MQALVDSHNKFLQASQPAASSERWEADRAGHAAKVVASLGQLGITDLADAANALQSIQDSVFSDEEKQKMAAVVMSAASSAPASASGRTGLKQQEHLAFEHYMTTEDWATMSAMTSSLSDRVGVIVTRAVSIGLLSLTEKTSQSITCIIIACMGDRCHQGAAASHSVLLELKAAFRRMRLQRSSDVKPSLDKFPENTDIFMLRCPGRYAADKPPVRSKVDAAALLACRGNVACRKSHSTLHQQEMPMGKHQQGVLQVVMPLLQAIMGSNRGEVNLQMLHPTTPPKAPRLSLCDNDPQGSGNRLPPTACTSFAALEDMPTKIKNHDDDGEHVCDGAPAKPVAHSVHEAAAMVQAALAAKSAAATAAKSEGKAAAKSKGPTSKAAAKGKAAAKTISAKATAKGKAQGKAKGKVKVKAKAAAQREHAVKFPELGCGKCRGIVGGCSQCKQRSFSGRRFQMR